jgi:colanic acid biosynthesis glycosyl transferase WcaI
MRIVVNDYSGHPFQVQLSRELARLGHVVLHLHFADFITPKGDLIRKADDPPTFDVDAITLGKPFPKNNLVKRRSFEKQYARNAIQRLEAFGPDLVVGCNNPLDAQSILQKWCAKSGVSFVFWLQDLYSVAITEILKKKNFVAGAAIGYWYRRLERKLLAKSDAIVAISNAFKEQLDAWHIRPDCVHVIENWGAIDTISVRPKRNPWSERHGLSDRKVVLYTGTLGFKHNPDTLLQLARRLTREGNGYLVVVSEGPAASYIASRSADEKLNVLVLPFQKASEYSDVLGSADVLVSIIEEAAAKYSVPSKVLSYLCAGRPQVLSVPLNNGSALMVSSSKSGLVVAPSDVEGFVGGVLAFLDNSERARAAGLAGRAYAEEAFDIRKIAANFLNVFKLVSRQRDLSHTAGAAARVAERTS